MVNQQLPFRIWFYFRSGWTIYLIFILGAVNTLTITYYLAIDSTPILKELFPSFIYYVISVIIIGVPPIILIGYIHIKKTPTYKAEQDINMEVNHHFIRHMTVMEVMLLLVIQQNDLMSKLINHEKLSKEETEKFQKTQKYLIELTKKRSFDWDELPTVFDSYYKKLDAD